MDFPTLARTIYRSVGANAGRLAIHLPAKFPVSGFPSVLGLCCVVYAIVQARYMLCHRPSSAHYAFRNKEDKGSRGCVREWKGALLEAWVILRRLRIICHCTVRVFLMSRTELVNRKGGFVLISVLPLYSRILSSCISKIILIKSCWVALDHLHECLPRVWWLHVIRKWFRTGNCTSYTSCFLATFWVLSNDAYSLLGNINRHKLCIYIFIHIYIYELLLSRRLNRDTDRDFCVQAESIALCIYIYQSLNIIIPNFFINRKED